MAGRGWYYPGSMLLDSHLVVAHEFTAATGWEPKPEGFCKGDRCVPVDGGVDSDGRVNIDLVADRLGMALVSDEASGTIALGPESGGPALSTAEVPDLELPDRHGNPFRLRSLLGRKVLLVAWASW